MTNLSFSAIPLTPEQVRLIEAEFEKHDRECGIAYAAEIPLSAQVLDGSVPVGACTGRVWANWLYISHLWVAKPYRGRGIATELLRQIEEQAVGHAAVGVYAWTASYNAPGFYLKNGYELALELKDKPIGSSAFVCRKYFRADQPG